MTPQQLEILVSAHRRPLELFAAQWTLAPEDCVQEAFLKLFANELPITNCRAWLYRVVRNLAIDSGRSESSRKRREELAGKNRNLFETKNSNSLNPFEVERALQQLTDEQREVIVTKLWGQLTFDEIGEALEIATSTAHRRYQLGLTQLRNLLSTFADTPNE